MAFKVKILTVLLFICLINSMQSASNGLPARGVEDEEKPPAPKPEEIKEEEATNSENSAKPSKPDSSNPVDPNVWLQNLGQIINKNTEWWQGNSPLSWLGGGSKSE